MTKSTKETLRDYFKAGYSGLFLTSYEEQRVEAELSAIAKEIGFSLFSWTVTDSLTGPVGGDSPHVWKNDAQEPLGPVELLDKINQVLPEKSICLAKDYHLFVSEPNPLVIRKVKDCLLIARNNNRHLVILGCNYKLTPELEKEFTVVDFALPDREQLGVVLKGIADSAGIKINGNRDPIIDAASGMTTTEAADAFALAVVESNRTDIPPAVIQREKAAVVRKSGLLTLENTDLDWSKIGGNQLVKSWVSKRRQAFSKEASAYKLPQPKGILLIGVPGCGKSMIAKTIANILGVPLLRLDGGKLFGGLVGQSEQNTRAVIQTAEAVAPCVLMCDELEKALSGSKSSGSTDGGTASRVLGTLLQWLQDKTSPVFVVATANDVSQLPPELLRKGRWDEMFFVDLPTEAEREEIVQVVATKFGRKPEDFDTKTVASVTDGFTGAEIEGAFVEAMFEGFAAGRELTTEDIICVCADVVPIQTTMKEHIEALRKWCDGRARRASDRVITRPKQGARKIST